MKAICDMTNEELIKAYSDKSVPYDKGLLIIQESFDRFRYYVEKKELPQFDTAQDTYRR